MNERLALLQAIAENPLEDTPRLVFADWLDEFGSAAEHEWAANLRLPMSATTSLMSSRGLQAAWDNVLIGGSTRSLTSCSRWRSGLPCEVSAPLAWWLDRPAVLRYWPITFARATDYRPTGRWAGLYVWSWQPAVEVAGYPCARRLFDAMQREFFSDIASAESALSAALRKVSRRTSAEYDSLTGVTC